MGADIKSWFNAQSNLNSEISKILEQMDQNSIELLLKRELNSVGAVILQHMPAERSAKLLTAMDSQKSAALVSEIISLRVANTISLEELYEELLKWKQQQAGYNLKAGVKLNSKNVLQGLDLQTQQKILSALQEKSPNDAKRLEAHLVKYDDLFRLQGPNLSKLFSRLCDEEIAALLSENSPTHIEKIRAHLSKRRLEGLQTVPFNQSKISLAKEKCLENAKVLGLLTELFETFV